MDTYIHKVFCIAHKFDSHYALLKVSNDSPSCHSLGGRSFHKWGPATEKLLSPSSLDEVWSEGTGHKLELLVQNQK